MDTSGGTTRSGPDPVVVSAGIGPLPPLYLPPPGQPEPPGQLLVAAARATRWLTRHLRRPAGSGPADRRSGA